jgi:hypothetical protein
MLTLNRFPLLGLWAMEAARRLGYTKAEAESLGHGYAVLYAIRARGRPKLTEGAKPEKPKPKPAAAEQFSFGGDDLDVTRAADGKVRARVGGERMQTPESYEASVEWKFPEGYYDKLQSAFRRVLKTLPPRQVDSRMLYDLYDDWKRACGVGRLVDLDKLIAWCAQRARRGRR